MIGYKISERKLKKIINLRLHATTNPSGTSRKGGRQSWSDRARAATSRLSVARTYQDSEEEIWRELSTIFAEIQGKGKCGYCEQCIPQHKRSGSAKTAKYDGDVEHYRPKKGVNDWKSPDGYPTGGADADCYYLLAFQTRNYLLACRVCNQDFKKNYFPIAGTRAPAHIFTPAQLQAEQPYLLHPLLPSEPDPESLIEFVGVNPKPKHTPNTPEYFRARVTIQLLGLGDGERDDLNKQRAKEIDLVYLAIIALNNDKNNTVAKKAIAELNDPTKPHRNCARSFYRLWKSDRVMAEKIAIEAQKLVT